MTAGRRKQAAGDSQATEDNGARGARGGAGDRGAWWTGGGAGRGVEGGREEAQRGSGLKRLGISEEEIVGRVGARAKHKHSARLHQHRIGGPSWPRSWAA